MGQSISTSIEIRIERSLRIRQLRKQVAALEAENNILRRKRKRLQQETKKLSEVSPDNVNEFVEKLLADPETNLGFVPDVIERSAQRTMLLFLLKSIAHTIDTSAIKFMGHEIVMRLQPIEKECEAYSSYDDDDYKSCN